MSNRIKEVSAKSNYIIEAVFFNGVVKQYDVSQLFDCFPQFKIFEQNKKEFDDVNVDVGGYAVVWNDELDLDAETIWEDGILIERENKPDLNHLLAYHLAMARENANMTQKELAEKTGIYQADISKVERGIGNPSLATLKRLADGLDMQVVIEFRNK